MPSYPGLPVPQFNVFLDRNDEPAQRACYASGVSFHIAAYELGGNTGTYVDAPFHRHVGGDDLATLPIEKLVDLPGLIVNGTPDGPIGADAFRDIDVRGRAVLVRTGWAQRWGGDYFRSGPYLTANACIHLVRSGAALVGIDCANIDNMKDPERPAHTILLDAGVPIVEHLRGLEQLAPNQSFRFFAAPPAIRGGTSFPVRAFALVD
jgi:arylformamidase